LRPLATVETGASKMTPAGQTEFGTTPDTGKPTADRSHFQSWPPRSPT
jgi:hypothetical protein